MLWEIGFDGIEVRDLRRRLGLDSGYASRLLRALEQQGLVAMGASADGPAAFAAPSSRRRASAERERLDRAPTSSPRRCSSRSTSAARAPAGRDGRGRAAAARLADRVRGRRPGLRDDVRYCIDAVLRRDRRALRRGGFDPRRARSPDAGELDAAERPVPRRPPARATGRVRRAAVQGRQAGRPEADVDRAATCAAPASAAARCGSSSATPREHGATAVRLETNRHLPEAIALYRVDRLRTRSRRSTTSATPTTGSRSSSTARPGLSRRGFRIARALMLPHERAIRRHGCRGLHRRMGDPPAARRGRGGGRARRRRRVRHRLRQLDADGVEHVDCDVTDRAAVVAALAGATRVIHLAGLQIPFCRADPSRGAAVNVVGTVNVFEAVKESAHDPRPGRVRLQRRGLRRRRRRHRAARPRRHPLRRLQARQRGHRAGVPAGRRDRVDRVPALLACTASAATRASPPRRPGRCSRRPAASRTRSRSPAPATCSSRRTSPRRASPPAGADFDGAATLNLSGPCPDVTEIVAAITAAVPDAQIAVDGPELPFPARLDASAYDGVVGAPEP